MRTLTSIFCVTLILFIAGCVYVPPVWDVGDEIRYVDQIQIGATTRDEVLELLGEPDRGDKNDCRIIYEGRWSEGYVILMTPIVAGEGLLDPQFWRIAIFFDENDVVQELITWLWPPYDTESDRRALAYLEKCGDPEGIYEYAEKLKGSEAWRGYCVAAHHGHAKARWKMGLSYNSPYYPRLDQNLVLAYVWYTLSFEAGYATAEQYRDRLSQEMTPDQITEAEHLVAEWEPNTAECEIEVAPLTLEDIEKRAHSGDRTPEEVIASYERERERRAKWEAERRLKLEACNLSFSEAIQLAAPTQYYLGTTCLTENGADPQADPLRWQWICLAAHGGHHDAQRRMGILIYYHSGETPNSQELVQAYKWFKLAMINDGKGSLSAISKKMTSDQIVDAEHLVAEWKSNPAECEAFSAQASN